IDPEGASHRVELTEALGGTTFVYLTAGNGERLIVEAHDDRPIQEGTQVGLAFDPASALFFDAHSEARLR
ncbi:MAG: TOBE domain-containing protein, partial [Pseudomonadota bacterium]